MKNPGRHRPRFSGNSGQSSAKTIRRLDQFRDIARLERRDFVTLTLRRRHVIEADTGIQREIPFQAPSVLPVPLGDKELTVGRLSRRCAGDNLSASTQERGGQANAR